ncbi:MAG: hypothetical protein HY026_09990 [Deltaproteobacteria bacterium]|nr:hypothetical protein [Deltaproteobacteria bacterium]
MSFKRITLSTEKKFWIITFIFVGLFIYGVYNIFHPNEFPISFVRGKVREIAPNIIVGPYPTESELIKLKGMGIKEVINLMDASSPIEAWIVNEEKMLSHKYDLEYLNFPMDFVNLESKANMNQISLLVNHLLYSNGKKIYIHCYLGKHRVKVLEKEFLKVKNAHRDVVK